MEAFSKYLRPFSISLASEAELKEAIEFIRPKLYLRDEENCADALTAAPAAQQKFAAT